MSSWILSWNIFILFERKKQNKEKSKGTQKTRTAKQKNEEFLTSKSFKIKKKTKERKRKSEPEKHYELQHTKRRGQGEEGCWVVIVGFVDFVVLLMSGNTELFL